MRNISSFGSFVGESLKNTVYLVTYSGPPVYDIDREPVGEYAIYAPPTREMALQHAEALADDMSSEYMSYLRSFDDPDYEPSEDEYDDGTDKESVMDMFLSHFDVKEIDLSDPKSVAYAFELADAARVLAGEEDTFYNVVDDLISRGAEADRLFDVVSPDDSEAERFAELFDEQPEVLDALARANNAYARTRKSNRMFGI